MYAFHTLTVQMIYENNFHELIAPDTELAFLAKEYSNIQVLEERYEDDRM